MNIIMNIIMIITIIIIIMIITVIVGYHGLITINHHQPSIINSDNIW